MSALTLSSAEKRSQISALYTSDAFDTQSAEVASRSGAASFGPAASGTGGHLLILIIKVSKVSEVYKGQAVRSIRSYENVNDGIVDVMMHGCRRQVRLSQTDVREAHALFRDYMPQYYRGRREQKGVLALAVFNKSADFARIGAEEAVIWVERKFGPAAIEYFAREQLGMVSPNLRARA